MLKKFSEKIGFTQTEIKVVLFLLIVFAIGLGAKYIFFQNSVEIAKKYDYSIQDSIFEDIKITDNVLRDKEIDPKTVDYKQEVLDFNKTNFKNNTKVVPPEKSININKASLEDLLKLPGIGEKTAGSIINFRKKITRFKKLEDILNVKGIGTSKLNKIKKYIYIE
ncbi:MAG: helix-hairpin-helix domain-containing protein [Ignavibacteriaceae bacterium]